MSPSDGLNHNRAAVLQTPDFDSQVQIGVMPRTVAAIYALHFRRGPLAFQFVLPEDERERPGFGVAHHPVPCLDLDGAVPLHLHPHIVHHIPQIITGWHMGDAQTELQPIAQCIGPAPVITRVLLFQTSVRNWASSLSCTRWANCRAERTVLSCCVDMGLVDGRDTGMETCERNDLVSLLLAVPVLLRAAVSARPVVPRLPRRCKY